MTAQSVDCLNTSKPDNLSSGSGRIGSLGRRNLKASHRRKWKAVSISESLARCEPNRCEGCIHIRFRLGRKVMRHNGRPFGGWRDSRVDRSDDIQSSERKGRRSSLVEGKLDQKVWRIFLFRNQESKSCVQRRLLRKSTLVTLIEASEWDDNVVQRFVFHWLIICKRCNVLWRPGNNR